MAEISKKLNIVPAASFVDATSGEPILTVSLSDTNKMPNPCDSSNDANLLNLGCMEMCFPGEFKEVKIWVSE